MPDTNRKTALVIGGTSGIGRAAAIEFGKAGYNVVLAGRGVENGRQTAQEIHAMNVAAAFVETDVANARQIQALTDTAIERFGRIDVAVNNAGIAGKMGPLQDATESDFDELVRVNLKGVWLGMKFQIPHMLSRRSGAIVNVSSIGGVVGFPNTAIYCATKHGIIGLTKTAALELAGSGVRVNAVAPGATATGLLARMSGGEQNQQQVASQVPMHRVADPREMAQCIVWLASEAASYVTGHTLLADGGLTAQ